MATTASASSAPTNNQDETPTWTYPTRFCRICREDVPATVTMYPPGLPIQFQRPFVEYKNEDEYGRLIKPCMCRGSLRYIHELCLLRSRTENNRSGSMWKCHECGHQFNFKRLTAQRYLSSRITTAFLTAAFMTTVVFALGFIADPIINMYMDPYDSLVGHELWEELEIRSAGNGPVSAWAQHFAKGFISMGLVGFLKTLFLNPFQWINIRMGGTWTSTRATTGRDRAVNISWIAVVIGVCSAFVFFYKWVEAFVKRTLQRIGNNIVDTQLPTDDDDLKPPPGWKPSGPSEAKPATEQSKAGASSTSPITSPAQANTGQPQPEVQAQPPAPPLSLSSSNEVQSTASAAHSADDNTTSTDATPLMSGSWISVDKAENEDSTLAGANRQGWSFSNI